MAEWYYLLNGENGLFSEFPRQDIKYPQLLISSTYGLIKGKRRFCLFNSAGEFRRYFENTPKKERNFYEVILGEMPQKPHFDIDGITLDAVDNMEETISQIVEATEKAFLTIGIKADELRWYGSNRKDKKSLHLVIPGYYVKDNVEAKRIYYFLKEQIPSYLFSFFDHMVYSKIQSFRTLGSCKNSDRRYKKLMFREEDENSFNESLITRIKSDMKEFPYLDISINDTDKASYNTINIDDEVILESIDKVLDYLGRKNFRFYNMSGCFMTFERFNSTHCSICQVQHDSIYPFARITSNFKVFLYCYRSRQYCKPKQSQRIEIHDFVSLNDFSGYIDESIEEKKESKKALDNFKISCTVDDVSKSRQLNSKDEDLNLFKKLKRIPIKGA